VYASVEPYSASQPRAGPQVPQRVQPIDPDELSEADRWKAAQTVAATLTTAHSPHPAHSPNHFLKVQLRRLSSPLTLTRRLRVRVTRARDAERENGAGSQGCQWSPDGSCLLTSCEDNVMRVYDLPTDCLVRPAAAAAVPNRPTTHTRMPSRPSASTDRRHAVSPLPRSPGSSDPRRGVQRRRAGVRAAARRLRRRGERAGGRDGVRLLLVQPDGRHGARVMLLLHVHARQAGAPVGRCHGPGEPASPTLKYHPASS
jgi:hypothetical protein